MNDTPATQPSIVPSVVAGVVVAAIGPALWVGCFKIGAVWLAAIGIGVLVGLAMRLTNRANDRRPQPIAAVLVALSCFAGYLITDLTVIHWIDPATGDPIHPSVGDALQRLVQDISTIVFVAVGAYIAYLLARRSPSATATE